MAQARLHGRRVSSLECVRGITVGGERHIYPTQAQCPEYASIFKDGRAALTQSSQRTKCSRVREPYVRQPTRHDTQADPRASKTSKPAFAHDSCRVPLWDMKTAGSWHRYSPHNHVWEKPVGVKTQSRLYVPKGVPAKQNLAAITRQTKGTTQSRTMLRQNQTNTTESRGVSPQHVNHVRQALSSYGRGLYRYRCEKLTWAPP